MIKIIAVVTRKVGLPYKEFLRLWQVEHPAYVRELPSIRRYVQNLAVGRHHTWPFDGAAELWFDSTHAVKQAFESSEADALREHESRFLGDLQWFLAEETEVKLTDRGEICVK